MGAFVDRLLQDGGRWGWARWLGYDYYYYYYYYYYYCAHCDSQGGSHGGSHPTRGIARHRWRRAQRPSQRTGRRRSETIWRHESGERGERRPAHPAQQELAGPLKPSGDDLTTG